MAVLSLQIISGSLIAGLTPVVVPAANAIEPVTPDCISGNDFDAASVGSVNGQEGWESTGPYDQEVVLNTYGFTEFGCKSLRMSNAVTSGAFGDQTFSFSTTNEAGETEATSHGESGGTRQNHFEAQFSIASTDSAQQPGLALSVSPDRGDGSRMSYVRFADDTNGIDVYFDDAQGTSSPVNFIETLIANDLDRSVSHTLKFAIDYLDGPSNDVVKVFIDGVLVHTGTTWENYYRYDAEQAGNGNEVPTTDTLIFRASGTAAPATDSKGFLIDNVSELSATVPPDTSGIQFVNSPKYVRQNNGGDLSAQLVAPSTATAVRFYVDGSATPIAGVNVGGATASTDWWRLYTPLPAGEHTITAEAEIYSSWYAAFGTGIAYSLDTPTATYVIPQANQYFRPDDEVARLRIDDEFDQFLKMIVTIDGTSTTVLRAACTDQGETVLCGVSGLGLDEGVYTASTTTYTKANNRLDNFVSPQFTVDATPPVVADLTIDNDVSGVVADSIEASATATDNLNVESINFYVTVPRNDGACTGNGTKLAEQRVTAADGDGRYHAVLDVSATSDGEYCVTAIARDNAKNNGNLMHQKVTVQHVAPEPASMTLGYETAETGTADGIGSCPVTTADLSAANGTASMENLEWTYVPAADHYDVYGYVWNGSAWNAAGPYSLSNLEGSNQEIDDINGVFTYKAFATNEATYAYQIKAIDAGGNVIAQTPAVDDAFTCTFTVDRTPPADTTAPEAPEHLSPADGSTLTAAAFDKADWTDVADPSSPVVYYYEVSNSPATNGDGSLASVVYSSSALSLSEILTPGTPEGVYYWHVSAVDAAGNTSAWTSPWMVTVDNTPADTTAPVVQILGYRNQADGSYDGTQPIRACGTTTNSAFIAFEWAEDGTDASQPLSYEYKIIAGPTAVGYTQTHTDTHHNGGIPLEGTYTIQITPTDAAGNTGAPVTCDMTYDAAYEDLVACELNDDGPVAYWNFDENDGSAAADSAGSADGTVNGALWSSDVPALGYTDASSLSFDGSDDAVTVGNVPALGFDADDAFSASAWINGSAFSGYQTIIQKIDDTDATRRGYLFTMNNGAPEVWILHDYSANNYIRVTSTVAASLASWHNVAFSYDGSGQAAGVRIYLDGSDVTGATLQDTLDGTIDHDQEFEIGFRTDAGSQAFAGSIDDVRVYDRVLGADEAAGLSAGSCNTEDTSPAGPGESCSIDQDCISGLVCSANVCSEPPAPVDNDNDGFSADVDCDDADENVYPNAAELDDDKDNDCDGESDEGITSPESGGGDSQTNGITARNDHSGSSNGFRGSQTNVLIGAVDFITKFIFGGGNTPRGSFGGIAPGSFGGGPDIPFTDDEIQVICSMRKAMPEVVNAAMREWFADYLAKSMDRDADMVLEALRDPDLCDTGDEVLSAVVEPTPFRVSAAGFPLSSNPTWNACITGHVTLSDIRNNPDKDNDGLGRDCSFYRTKNMWWHPDLQIYFTFNRAKRQISLPAGYVIEQDAAVSKL